eukprot:1159202-Pelagomonas_calceolata.AAC.13
MPPACEGVDSAMDRMWSPVCEGRGVGLNRKEGQSTGEWIINQVEGTGFNSWQGLFQGSINHVRVEDDQRERMITQVGGAYFNSWQRLYQEDMYHVQGRG